MRILTAILALVVTAAMCGRAAKAQAVGIQSVSFDNVRSPVAHSAFFVRPYLISEDRSRPRFWTRSTIALVTLDGAAKAADGYITRRNIAGGGLEYDPLARPFVHTTGVQVVATGAMFGAEIAAAYLFHRRRHDNIGHLILVNGAVLNSCGAISSFKNRIKNW
jgi:hypothetical protein